MMNSPRTRVSHCFCRRKQWRRDRVVECQPTRCNARLPIRSLEVDAEFADDLTFHDVAEYVLLYVRVT